MTVVDWFKALWPVAVVLVALGVRLEMGQALNKQRLKTIERDIEATMKQSENAVEAVHERLSRHENETGKRLTEIQADIKTLLGRHT